MASKKTRKAGTRDSNANKDIFVGRIPATVQAACEAEAEAAGLRSKGAFVRQCVAKALIKAGYELVPETAAACHV